MICRQLHNERSRIALKNLGFLQDNTGADDCRDAKEVRRGCYPCRAAEDGACNHGDERRLCAARNKGRRHDGHAAVFFVLNGTGSHDARNAAAGTDQNRNEGLAGQAKAAENTVHDEGNTRHVAASLQECQEDEQNEHLRHKAENRADTGNDTVQNQTGQPVCTADAGQSLFYKYRNARNPNAVVCRIRSLIAVLIQNCHGSGQIVNGSGLVLGCQRFFVLYLIGRFGACRNGCSELRQRSLCSFRIVILGLGIHRCFYSGGVHALLGLIGDKAVCNGQCIVVLVRYIGIRRGTDAEQVPAVAEHAVICPVGSHCTNRGNRYIVHDKHNNRKNRQSQNTVGYDSINLIGNRQLAGGYLFIAALDDGCNINVSLVGDDGLGVIILLGLGSLDVLLDVRARLLGQVQLFQNLAVALENLDGIPALLFLRHVVQNQLLNVCQCVLYRTAERVLRDGLFVLCRMNGRLGSLHDASALERGDFYHLTAQLSAKLLDVDFIAVLLDNIHHVYCDNDRNAQLGQLGGQVQVALQIGAVNDVQNGIRTFAEQVISRYHFLQCVRRQRVDARKVRDDDITVLLQLALFFLNRYARPVADELIGTGQTVEQGCFTTVRIAG